MPAPVVIGILGVVCRLLLGTAARTGASAAARGVAGVSLRRLLLSPSARGVAISGGINGAAQLGAQLWELEGRWQEVNLKAVGTAAALGGMGYGVLIRVATRFPAPLFVRQGGRWGFASASVWRNFTAQQFFMCSYTYFLYLTLHVVRNGWTLKDVERTLGQATADNMTFASIAQAMQAFLASPVGKQHLPGGYANPKVSLINAVITLAVRTVIQSLSAAADQDEDGVAEVEALRELAAELPSDLPPIEEVMRAQVPGMEGHARPTARMRHAGAGAH